LHSPNTKDYTQRLVQTRLDGLFKILKAMDGASSVHFIAPSSTWCTGVNRTALLNRTLFIPRPRCTVLTRRPCLSTKFRSARPQRLSLACEAEGREYVPIGGYRFSFGEPSQLYAAAAYIAVLTEMLFSKQRMCQTKRPTNHDWSPRSY